MCNGEVGKKVKVSFEIIITSNNPDQNGVLYSEKAIRNLADSAKNKPVVIYHKDGTSTQIGFLENGVYDGNKILLNGYLKESGTYEDVILGNERIKTVESADLKAFGIVAE